MAAHLGVGLAVGIWIFGPGAASTSILESAGAKYVKMVIFGFGSFSYLPSAELDIAAWEKNVRVDHLASRAFLHFDRPLQTQGLKSWRQARQALDGPTETWCMLCIIHLCT